MLGVDTSLIFFSALSSSDNFYQNLIVIEISYQNYCDEDMIGSCCCEIIQAIDYKKFKY